MNEFKKYIMRGEFERAYAKILSLNNKDLYDLLMDLAWDTGSIAIYGFISYLLLLEETSLLHIIASAILSNPLCILDGGYQTAFFHAKQALILEPENLEYMRYLLSFHTIPDQLLDKEKAINLAKKILIKDPENITAREIMKRYNVI